MAARRKSLPKKCVSKTPGARDAKELEKRIKRALEHALSGTIDGAHHKMYVIDQMVRALTGAPMKRKSSRYGGKRRYYAVQGESKEYLQWVSDAMKGEHGPKTYDWDTGAPP